MNFSNMLTELLKKYKVWTFIRQFNILYSKIKEKGGNRKEEIYTFKFKLISTYMLSSRQ